MISMPKKLKDQRNTERKNVGREPEFIIKM